MRSRLVAGNWKMHGSLAANRALLDAVVAGVQGVELKEWEGLVAPAGTPRAIIDKWNQELFQVLASSEVRARLADLGMSVVPGNSSAEFGELIRKELDHWGRFVRSTGLRPS